jgi:hypothetical protein
MSVSTYNDQDEKEIRSALLTEIGGKGMYSIAKEEMLTPSVVYVISRLKRSIAVHMLLVCDH